MPFPSITPTLNADGTATFERTCVFCRKVHTFTVEAVKLDRWIRGEFIQNVWPEMTADQREEMQSGTCTACWDEHMRDPDDD